MERRRALVNDEPNTDPTVAAGTDLICQSSDFVVSAPNYAFENRV